MYQYIYFTIQDRTKLERKRNGYKYSKPKNKFPEEGGGKIDSFFSRIHWHLAFQSFLLQAILLLEGHSSHHYC